MKHTHCFAEGRVESQAAIIETQATRALVRWVQQLTSLQNLFYRGLERLTHRFQNLRNLVGNGKRDVARVLLLPLPEPDGPFVIHTLTGGPVNLLEFHRLYRWRSSECNHTTTTARGDQTEVSLLSRWLLLDLGMYGTSPWTRAWYMEHSLHSAENMRQL